MRRKHGGISNQFVCSLMFLVVIIPLMVLPACSSRDIALSEEIQAITVYEFGDSREPLANVADMVRESQADSEMRQNLELQFAKVLRLPETTLACKDFICRQLWIIGTDITFPELETMLRDNDTTDMARYALGANESPEAGIVLRDALMDVNGTALIGIINTLGERREQENKKALELLLSHDEKAVADAAQIACDKIDGIR